MTFNFKQNALRKIMEKRREERAEIKKWAKDGGADNLINNIRKARKPSIKPNQLPF